MTRQLSPAGIAFLLAASGVSTVYAQDARKVVEPVAPPACAILTATGDSAAAGNDDTARIQNAIDKCAAGQAVRLSSQNEKRGFVAGPLVLRNGVSLLIDAATTLYASTNPKLFDRGAGTCGTVDKLGRGCKPFITADKTKGSGILGEGTVDGQGGHVVDGISESWWQLARRAQKEDARQNVPRLIEVTGSQDFTLHKITLRNSPNFHVTLNNVDGFTAWGMRIDTPATARNTDGIDPISSRNITIAYSHIRTGDDNIAIKAGGNGPTENISILHNHFYSGHGMSIGSETNGGVRRVLVEDLSMDGTTSGLRIKSDVSRGGVVDQVSYRNVCLRDVKTPIDISTHYNPNAEGSQIPVYTNIAFDGVHSVTPGRVIMQGYDAQHPLQATLRDVDIAGKADRRVEFAELRGDIISAPAAACTDRFTAFPAVATITTRPQLSIEQSRQYAYAEVLKYVGAAGNETIDPWDPLADPLAKGAAFTPDYIVDKAAKADGVKLFHTVQEAVSRAVADSRDHPAKRLYMLLKPGTYQELVYIPASAAPITMYGEGKDASATKITAKLDASNTGADYARQYDAQFAKAAPAVQAMYASIKDRAQIGTFGTATVWVQDKGFQARNLTFENGYNKDTGNARAEALPNINNIHHQALALQVDGADKAQFENIRLIGFQDTLYLKSPQIATTSRSFFNKSYIEGDVDFIFGDSTAYFHQTEIRSLGDRGLSYAAAPDTHVKTRYGFVFDNCRFTHDASPNARNGAFYLLRQWFHNSRCTPYDKVPVDGYACTFGPSNGYQAPKGTIARNSLEAVGKMVVMNSRIGAHINRTSPWSDWNKKGTLAYRPVQYNSDDHWNNLVKAGIDPVTDLGYTAKPSPAEVFLGEFNNSDE
ncbi:pectin lyase fold-containing protein [Duganella sp. BJB488]|uniref:pectinesterase family protein n=1 Tax=unclassified Duganella TaxID=2636909 RepID=UPI000E3571EC|nr:MULTISPECIES: pectinesterase family protein [unclassified Duganella]RFP22901.1 pectin lyase fold-containing protein [Duganella sp. BJB489]RFP25023.1 pectin lyase fold-containing protein [Duganella sp. BJB488]RFP33900.1 pectin lyase fold-containing protein [Duganella sp. BJB480]